MSGGAGGRWWCYAQCGYLQRGFTYSVLLPTAWFYLQRGFTYSVVLPTAWFYRQRGYLQRGFTYSVVSEARAIASAQACRSYPRTCALAIARASEGERCHLEPIVAEALATA